MKFITRAFLLLMILLFGCLFSQGVRAESKSHTGKDEVNITKITPRVACDLPVPFEGPFSFELQYKLQSASKGHLRACVFLWHPGGKGRLSPGSSLSGLKPLCKIFDREVKKGGGTCHITTDPISIKSVDSNNCQVVVVINMQDPNKKELCWATSYCFLRGSMSVVTAKPIKGRDFSSVASCFPEAGVLEVGKSHQFKVRVRYNLQTNDWGYINLELGDPSRRAGTGPWHCMAIPVKKGAGTVTVMTRRVFFPVALAGSQLRLEVPFRAQALGGTVNMDNAATWTLRRPAK